MSDKKEDFNHAPKILEDKMYKLLRHECIAEFNKNRQLGEECNFVGCDFRLLDLQGINAKGHVVDDDGATIYANVFNESFPKE